MMDLTITLFERLGLLLVIAFVMTRTPGFRSLLYREFSAKMVIVHAFVFGLFGIVSTFAGVVLEEGSIVIPNFVWSVGENQLVVSLSLVAIVIAGLLGGPIVGLGAGMIAGGHLLFLGGIGALANGLVNPLTGFLAGWTARFFSQERVISPFKALFIGVFPPVLHMQLLLILHPEATDTISIVDTIGLPLVLSNCLAIAIFTAMIGIVLREEENEAAAATRRALAIAEEALPFLQKDSQTGMAEGIASLLYGRLGLAAVSVANGTEILAHTGIGGNHHCPGDPIRTSLAREAMASKKMQVAYSKAGIECNQAKCPLEAAIMIPIMEGEEATYLIKFYFRKAQHIRPVELTLAEGLGQLLSKQLGTITAEKLKTHIRDAELRNLQAQINPHFLFNTLHLIASLFRENPEQARHITIQLAHYMRFNIRLVSRSLVKLEKEYDHVRAYVAIIQERFRDRLDIQFHLDGHVPDVAIPPSTLQPLVENAIQHGLENVLRGGKVEIVMEQREDRLFFAVRDNGSGFSEEMLLHVMKKPLTQEQDGGTGLYNVNQRLITLLGESAGLRIKNVADGGSEVSFYLPWEDSIKRGVFS
jgi:two-component system sensor histidine kinase LytS